MMAGHHQNETIKMIWGLFIGPFYYFVRSFKSSDKTYPTYQSQPNSIDCVARSALYRYIGLIIIFGAQGFVGNDDSATKYYKTLHNIKILKQTIEKYCKKTNKIKNCVWVYECMSVCIFTVFIVRQKW
jgi:hypothetical protein